MPLADPADQLIDPTDFPALYKTADRTSLDAQKRFLVILRIRLGGLLIAGMGGALGWSFANVQVGGLVSLVGFVAAIAAELYSATTHPDRSWYEGRAAAESAKTLTWRFVVRGESFEDINDPEAQAKFIRDLREILLDLDSIQLLVEEDGSQVTHKMRSLRGRDFEFRRKLYLERRILDQQSWYTQKAIWNKKRGDQWFFASLVFESLGIIGGAARAFGGLQIDLLGLLAAVASTIIAWAQAKQYRTLAVAYSITASELASVASEAEAVSSDQNWGKFVGQAEEAISREHTLWRASRGIRIRPLSGGTHA